MRPNRPAGVLRPGGRLRAALAQPSLLMVVPAAVALAATNLIPGLRLNEFWSADLLVGWGKASVDLTIASIVLDGLMTAFFLLVGLEIRRELAFGTLRSFRPLRAFTWVARPGSGRRRA